MKIWKLIAGILSFIFTPILVFQLCAAGLVNVIEINGESSGFAGVMIAVLLLAGGIVSITTRNSLGNGGNIALFVIYGLAYLLGTLFTGNFSDLRVWAWWCLINLLVVVAAIIYAVMTKNRMKSAIAVAKMQDRSMPGANVQNWYYQFNNIWYGPFTKQQIPMLYSSGYINSKTPVYYEGAQQATYAENSALRSYIPGAIVPESSFAPAFVSVLISVAIGIVCVLIPVTAVKVPDWNIDWGTDAYVSSDGDVGFFVNGGIVVFSGENMEGYLSPNKKYYVVLNSEGKCTMYTDPAGKGKVLSEDTEHILAINNDGVFVRQVKTDHIVFLYFDEREAFDTGLTKYNATRFSENYMSIAGLTGSGDLFVYTVGDTELKHVGKTGSIDISAVSNNGENVIWSDQKDGDICVYMIKNGAPERIGKLGTEDDYTYTSGFFFDDGKSFIVEADLSDKIIMSVNGKEPREINLAGANCIYSILDQNGRRIESESSNVKSIYYFTVNDEDYDIMSLYHMSLNGESTEIASNIEILYGFHNGTYSNYYFANNRLFYLDYDGDLYIKDLKKNVSKRITTEVDAIFVPENGKCVYLVKSGILYYTLVSDKNHKLNMICNNFDEKCRVAITDKWDSIYYIADKKCIEYTVGSTTEESDYYQGSLYRYTIGEQPVFLQDEIVSFCEDSEYMEFAHPIVRKLQRMDKGDLVEEIGTIRDDKYTVIIDEVK